MVSNHSFDKVSPTALLVAYLRQFTDIPYSQEIAQGIQAETFITQVLDDPSLLPWEMAILFEARYKAINRVIAQVNPSQILELASGFVSRGLDFSQSSEIIFIESDLPQVITQKQELIEQLIGTSSHLHCLSIDAAQDPNQLLGCHPYLMPDQPLTVLCEGFLIYLTFAQKKQVFKNVREILEHYGGVWITADLVSLETFQKRHQVNPNWSKLAKKINSLTERTPTKTYFEDFNQVQQFCDNQGFTVQPFSMLEVVDQLSCFQRLNLSLDLTDPILGESSIFVLTLNN